MRYIDLMAGISRTFWSLSRTTWVQKPGYITFRPRSSIWKISAAGQPWITRLPFPVHVVEKVEVYDRISRNRFVTRYAYHHGYFDGTEREFRGFGRVDQLDTEEFAALSRSDDFPYGDNMSRPRTYLRS